MEGGEILREFMFNLNFDDVHSESGTDCGGAATARSAMLRGSTGRAFGGSRKDIERKGLIQHSKKNRGRGSPRNTPTKKRLRSVRKGGANIFMVAEFKAGRRTTRVTQPEDEEGLREIPQTHG